MGILICGPNGAGKSTLGKALAEKLHFRLIDIETLFFPRTDCDYVYGFSRTCEEVEEILKREVEMQENFVLASCKGAYRNAIGFHFQYIVWLDAPKDVRLQRVKHRSFRKFGDRMLPGGDLHEQEERFFAAVSAKEETAAEEWLKSVSCPVLRLDGTKPVEENIALITELIQR